MRKRFHILLMALAAVILSVSLETTSLAASEERASDTIFLEPEIFWEDDVPVDLSWKTEQDNGRWIDAMGIAGDSNSLIIILNNLEKDKEADIPVRQPDGTKIVPKSRQIAGNSRLFYYSKGDEGQWKEIFAVNCHISGGKESEDLIYGAYRLESSFGNEKNPGSLVPYHQLTSDDYWITDPDNEKFGGIVSAGEVEPGEDSCVRLQEMRAFSNFGMILKPESEGDAYPALLVNCQQPGINDNTFSGIQLVQSYLRMLIQSVDGETRILIAEDLEALEDM